MASKSNANDTLTIEDAIWDQLRGNAFVGVSGRSEWNDGKRHCSSPTVHAMDMAKLISAWRSKKNVEES